MIDFFGKNDRVGLSPLLLEEVAHECGTFLFEHACGDLRAGMQCLWGKAAEASLGVCRTVDEAAELTPSDGSGTHDAWLYGDV